MFEDFDFDAFWETSDYAGQYVEVPLTADLLSAVEQELGFRLPAAYLTFMAHQNGGVPTRTCFPTRTPTSWAEDHVAISGFLGIGREKTYSLLGRLGSTFMQAQWGYPDFGFCICDCPSAGHDMIMLDYRACGPEGEPAVVHVDQEDDFKVTFLAPSFESFVRGLVPGSDFDTSEQDLRDALARIASGSFSTALACLVAASPDPRATEASLRALLGAIATEKGYFALHSDAKSHLAYDVLFALYSGAHHVTSVEAFLEVYPDLMCDGEVSTGGYAPQFLSDWMNQRLASGAIVDRGGRLALSEAHARTVTEGLAGAPALGRKTP